MDVIFAANPVYLPLPLPVRAVWLLRPPVRYAVVASHGVWRSLVARFVRDEEVVGSIPATPTVMCRDTSTGVPTFLSPRPPIRGGFRGRVEQDLGSR